jgi:hypothetical protein
VGKQLENNDLRERERELRNLDRVLRRAWYRLVTDPVVRGDLG